MPGKPYILISTSRILCSLLAATVATGCVTAGDRRDYKISAKKSFSSDEIRHAGDPIDRYPALAQHFRLEKEIEAMTIGISAEYVADITGAKKTKKTYFIVEKRIDMSRFASMTRKDLYAEIGRNFDADWNRVKELTLISNTSDFFKKLDAASIYRIRFTTFSPDPVDFTITIEADCGITFIEEMR